MGAMRHTAKIFLQMESPKAVATLYLASGRRMSVLLQRHLPVIDQLEEAPVLAGPLDLLHNLWTGPVKASQQSSSVYHRYIQFLHACLRLGGHALAAVFDIACAKVQNWMPVALVDTHTNSQLLYISRDQLPACSRTTDVGYGQTGV